MHFQDACFFCHTGKLQIYPLTNFFYFLCFSLRCLKQPQKEIEIKNNAKSRLDKHITIVLNIQHSSVSWFFTCSTKSKTSVNFEDYNFKEQDLNMDPRTDSGIFASTT